MVFAKIFDVLAVLF
jgi:hypothetical protein